MAKGRTSDGGELGPLMIAAKQTADGHKPLVRDAAGSRPFEAEPADFLATLERLAAPERAERPKLEPRDNNS